METGESSGADEHCFCVSNPLGWDGDAAAYVAREQLSTVSNPLGWDGDDGVRFRAAPRLDGF